MVEERKGNRWGKLGNNRNVPHSSVSLGKVEEAQGITRLCDRLKEERQQLAYQGSRIPSMIDTAMR